MLKKKKTLAVPKNQQLIDLLKLEVIIFGIRLVYIFQGPFLGVFVNEKDTVDVVHGFENQGWTAWVRFRFINFDSSSIALQVDVPLTSRDYQGNKAFRGI
jgi:hypothetical protein